MKLDLQGLAVEYGSGATALTAVDGVDAFVPQGGTLGLVGESGCGKSSLARAVVGLAEVRRGRILLDGVDYTSRRKRNAPEFRRRVQMVFQDPYSSLNPRMTVEETVSEVLPRAQRGRAVRHKEVARLVDLVGLPTSALQRYPHQFSGGQRQRIAIARALAVQPEVVIHDEVTSALDVSVQATILNLLKELQRELGLSYLFISHDLSTVRYMSDRVAVMYLGRIVESASTEVLFDQPRHPYTKALIASIPQVGVGRRPAALKGELPDPRHPPQGCRFHTRCPIGPNVHPERAVCIDVDPALGETDPVHYAACHFAAESVEQGL
ncbi:MAG: peptide/nickel transport system ATP-binding protein [Actinomycetota bacterium]|jgi:oligopeptide/dipeptide ABC transporter ATP-binding protein|nr:peptide/nickel transport system ATP-binding protein [Actinomycetota bacterium]